MSSTPPFPHVAPLHLVQGENHATLGSGLHGVHRDHRPRFTSPPKMNTCPLKKGPLYSFYTEQVVFQTPTNQHEFKTCTVETLMT